jgi:hypothetical protein
MVSTRALLVAKVLLADKIAKHILEEWVTSPVSREEAWTRVYPAWPPKEPRVQREVSVVRTG